MSSIFTLCDIRIADQLDFDFGIRCYLLMLAGSGCCWYSMGVPSNLIPWIFPPLIAPSCAAPLPAGRAPACPPALAVACVWRCSVFRSYGTAPATLPGSGAMGLCWPLPGGDSTAGVRSASVRRTSTECDNRLTCTLGRSKPPPHPIDWEDNQRNAGSVMT